MHQIDFSNLIPESTLVFSVPDAKGKLHTWEVPPFSEETELAFWAWHKRMFAKRAAEQKKGMGIADATEVAEAEEVITKAREFGLVTKSNLILGMGETPDEVTSALQDLHDAGCEIITITQYLRPTKRHHPVERWVKPEEFVEHSTAAEQIGFAGVMAGPLVRSSYRAGRLYAQTVAHRGEELSPALAHLADSGPAAQEASSLLARG